MRHMGIREKERKEERRGEREREVERAAYFRLKLSLALKRSVIALRN